MGTFQKIQETIDSLFESERIIDSLKSQIITPRVYSRERTFNEPEYEHINQERKKDEEFNIKKKQEINGEIDNYNNKLDDLLLLIESEEGWLILSRNVVRKLGKFVEVFKDEMEYKVALSHNRTSQFKKPMPKTYTHKEKLL